MSSCLTAHSHGHVRNLERLVFTVLPTNRIETASLHLAARDRPRLAIYLNGIIYNADANQLVAGFTSQGVNYVNQLEGSFVLFVVAETAFYVLTDKVNSRKAYFIKQGDAWHIACDLDDLPTAACAVSVDALACFISNGVMFNDLTLFQGVSVARRASIHCFRAGRLDVGAYWNYRFTYADYNPVNERAYQEEFGRLLIDAVELRIRTAPKSAVSLSAGYDVRGILGILHDKLKIRDVPCLSYALDNSPSPESDAALSQQLAAICGYRHEIIRSYRGDFIAQLTGNAWQGRCIANFCDELDVWRSLADRAEFSDIIAGDQCFGGVDGNLDSDAAVLDSIGITGTAGLRWLRGRISDESYDAFSGALQRLSSDIMAKANAFEDPHDKKDYLRLDQRINHLILPWREYMLGQVGLVHNPFLDSKILEFVAKLPPRLRKNKIFYRQTISLMFPSLFNLKLASAAGYKMNWWRELVSNHRQLVELVEATDSRLDSFVSKAEFVDLLKSVAARSTKALTDLSRGVNYVRKRSPVADSAITALAGPRIGQGGRSVPAVQLVIRLLVLRIYLSSRSGGK
jgi:asparagine synthase (glutamine-hydrolysing)